MSAVDNDKPERFPKDRWGVGQPALMLLNAWAREIDLTFGSTPYLVGSVCYSKTWRDVDVALILDDEKWDHLFGPYDQQRDGWENPFLAGMQIAFAVWGREATGLPIDFKIQRRTQANEEFRGPRCALGIVPLNDPRWAPAWQKRSDS